MILRAQILLMTGLLAGCFSLEREPAIPQMGADAVEHVIAYNSGWYLLGCLPLVCGNVNDSSWCPFSIFCDEVQHGLVGGRVLSEAEKCGCDVRDMTCLDDQLVFFDCYYAPVPWIIQYKEVNVSANFVRREGGR